MFLSFITSLSISLWLSAMNVFFRDIQRIIPFILSIWLFLTPVAYSLESVPKRWRDLYLLNPMTGVVVGFRWALFGTEQLDLVALGISIGIVVLLFSSGLLFFGYMERLFADIV
jgi:lipopolysaccharide transport system permease protein